MTTATRAALAMLIMLFWACEPPQTDQNQSASTDHTADREMIGKIFDETLVNGECYEALRELCKEVGPRLSGSFGARKAVEWGKTRLEGYGFDKVFLQDVMVPHWERGAKEIARIEPEGIDLSVLALGGSVATPPQGILAQVVEVKSLDEVDELGDKVRGKIVFYNRAFDHRNIQTGPGYGGVVDQRSRGALTAAKYGALAVIIRSASSSFDDAPHTGAMRYNAETDSIPGAALGIASADRLTTALAVNPDLQLFLKMNCRWHADAPSHNVVGELTGTEHPDKIIVFGGHLDSWDVGEGAHDDGAGITHSMEVLRTLKALDYKPKHTLRCVFWINEENGNRGGERYAELAIENKEDHLIAIESDAGGFSPRGFGLSGDDSSLEKMRSWLPLFPQATIGYINKGGGGVDIGPLHRKTDTPMMGLSVDSQRMFDLHHAPTDVFETVNQRELKLGAASMAAMIYLIDQHGL